jgi:hypothetical protein
MLNDNSFHEFAQELRGELIQPGDQRYDTARKLYNGMIDRRPRAIALCADETSTHTGLRDRELLGVLAYTFARIGAAVNLKVEDYYQ